MVNKKRLINYQNKSETGIFVAVVLILLAGFLSSQVYEEPQRPIPIIVGANVVTGFAAASTFSSTCNSANTVFKTTGNIDALAAPYDSTDTKFNTNVCVSSDSGHTCKTDGSNLVARITSDGGVSLPTTQKISIPNFSDAYSAGCFLARGTASERYGSSQYPNWNIDDPNSKKCSTTCGGSTSLGFMENYDSSNINYWRYEICVQSTEVVGETVKCRYDAKKETTCNLPSCSVGQLQAVVEERNPDIDNIYPGPSVITRFGICSNAKIIADMCHENDWEKRRSCTTAGHAGYIKIKSPADISGNWRDGQATFVDRVSNGPYAPVDYYFWDIYIEKTSTDVCFGTGAYHVEDNAKGNCASGSCVYTISASQWGKVGHCGNDPYAASEPYAKTVCTGGTAAAAPSACTGTDCSVSACDSQNACDSNNQCKWDAYAKKGAGECRSQAGVCNSPALGIKLCDYKDFLKGDYSCLRKDQQGYYTEACVGSGSVGFWNVIEVY